jgi:fibronectin type 3 domain-containing protein
VTGYAIYRRASETDSWVRVATVPAATTSTIDSSIPKNTPHQYMIRALNVLVESDNSNTTAATSGWDNLKPGAAPSATAEDEEADQGKSVLVYWTLSPDDGAAANDVSEYRILRSTVEGYAGELVGTADAGGGFYRDTSVVDQIDYFYTVQAYDGYLLSALSPQTTAVKSIDNTPPRKPWNANAIDTPTDNGHSMSVTWNISQDDGAGARDVAWYVIYRSTTSPTAPNFGPQVGQVLGGTRTYLDLNIPDGVDYWYTIIALDGSNQSEPSNTVGPVSAADNLPPGAPPTLTAAVTSLPREDAKVLVQWTGSVDDTPAGDVREYLLYRSTNQETFGEPLVRVPSGTFQYEDTLVPAEQDLYYMVIAYDGELLSDRSEVAGPVRVRDQVLPDPPTNVRAESGADSVTIRWDESLSEDVIGYNLYRSTDIATGYVKINSTLVTGTQYVDGHLTARQQYWYRMSAVDDASPSNESVQTEPVGAPALDLTPPAAPTGLVPTISDSAVSLRWSESTEVDLAGYLVYRRGPDETDFVRITDQPLQTPFFLDGDVTNLLTYQYQVTAVDNVTPPNESAPSPVASATPENVQKISLAAGLHLVSFARSGADPRPALGLGLTGSDWKLARWWPPSQDAVYYFTTPDHFDAVASLDPPDCHGSLPTVLQAPAGLGFWVRVGQATDLLVRGDPVPQTSDYVVRLQSGWNLIGNPFDAAVRWADVESEPADAVLAVAWGYDQARGYFPVFSTQVTGGATGLDQARGYWVYATRDALLRFPGPQAAASAAGGGMGAHSLAAGMEWMLRLEARCGNVSDEAVYVGSGDAEGGSPLVRGIVSPPNVAPSVDLYLTGERQGERYASSFLARGIHEGVWELLLETQELEGTTEVSCPDLRQLPRELRATLVDVESGRRCDLRGGEVLSVPSGGVRRLRLEVERAGSGSLLSELAADPLARGVAVRYRLTTSARVTVTVRNAAGRVVKTLVADSVQGAGVRELQLPQRSDRGSALPSGRYTVEVEARSGEGRRDSLRASFNW